MEYCSLKNATIGEGCIISGCESTEPFQVDSRCILFTLCIDDNGKRFYTTILLHTDDDVKAKNKEIHWMGRKTFETDTSLWNAKLFPLAKNRQSSLHATLDLMRGAALNGRSISIAEAVCRNDLKEMVTFRRRLRHQCLSCVYP